MKLMKASLFFIWRDMRQSDFRLKRAFLSTGYSERQRRILVYNDIDSNRFTKESRSTGGSSDAAARVKRK